MPRFIPLLSGLANAGMIERRAFPGVASETRAWRQERAPRCIRLFVGGRVKPGHDGKVLNSNKNVMRVLDTRIHESSWQTVRRVKPDSSGSSLGTTVSGGGARPNLRPSRPLRPSGGGGKVRGAGATGDVS